MKRAIAWFAQNTVAANLLMALIMITGLMTMFSTKKEVFPEFSLDTLTVTVQYLGAAPEEVEEAVCIRIEEAIQGLDGVKKITSKASEGFGTVVVEMELGADTRKVQDDVKARVDAIDTFPQETEKPIITELTNRSQVINLAVWGDADERSLKNLVERVRDEISAQPGITLVETANVRPYEISIEIGENDLRRHGLTFDQVAGAIRRSSLDLPGGSVKTEGGEILLRAKGQAEIGLEFEDIVLLTRPDGTHLMLGDVARVVDGFAETDQITRFSGKPAALLSIFRTGDQSALDIAGKVKEYVKNAQRWVPEGVTLTTYMDNSKVLQDRLNLLIRNGRAGFVLVFILLALFLRFRLAFWVSLGIPMSFLGAMWLMPTLDVSFNLISMFAFIVVLGIVVDDAIVAGENIFTHQHRHGEGLRGAIEGAQEISKPVIFAVLTSVAAFFPLTMVPGAMGKIMRTIPLIVIPCLLFSLVESLFILPAHLSHYRKKPPGRHRGPWRRFQERISNGLVRFIDRIYKPSLELALRRRYLTVAIGFATLILTVGMWLGGWTKFHFFPEVEADFIFATLTMPQGTPVEKTSEAMKHIERSAAEVRSALEEETGRDMFRYIVTSVGDQPFTRAQGGHIGTSGATTAAHLGEVLIELLPAEDRDIGSTEMAARWRKVTGAIPEAVELAFSSSLFSPGDDINVQLTGSSIRQLDEAAAELKLRLAEYAGVNEIADSFLEGKKEVKLGITPAAETLGLTLSDLARQVRQAFYGEEAQRIVRGREDIRVMVRYPESERRSLGDMENMRIRTPEGQEVPFSQVAVVHRGRGFSSIDRVDRRRAVNVTAMVDENVANTNEIIADLQTAALPEIMAKHPGILYSFEGQMAEQRDTIGGLKRGFTIALIAIFALLAIPLRSYAQAVVIMTAIPFGLVGAVWGHLIMGMNLTILSMFGIVALTGVVVNDALVMVDFINRHRRQGGRLIDAVRNAGVVRFRPILLTSLTTFAGLTPLLLEKSMQAKFLVPMAVSLAFGVIFATAITLILIPSGYMIMEDVKSLFRRNTPRAGMNPAPTNM